MSLRIVTPALCSLIATLVLFAPPRAVAGPQPFYGVAATGVPTAQELQLAARAGAQSVRINMPWRFVEPSRGMRNWRSVDRIVGDAAAAGLEVVPLLAGTPAWVNANPAQPPIHSTDQMNIWFAFARDAAARYGAGGSFWAENPLIVPRPIQYWQVWNEVNLGQFWGGRPSPRRYLGLVAVTRDGLHAADPQAKILMAGLIPFQSAAKNTVSGRNYLEGLYKPKLRKRAKELISAVAVHPYGKTPKITLKGLNKMRLTLDRAKARKTPLWVTEFGWSTGGYDLRASPVPSSLQGQATKLRNAYRAMRKERKRLRLKRAFYFSLSDYDQPGVEDNWATRMGLLDLGGQPKPSFYAFARQAGGTP